MTSLAYLYHRWATMPQKIARAIRAGICHPKLSVVPSSSCCSATPKKSSTMNSAVAPAISIPPPTSIIAPHLPIVVFYTNGWHVDASSDQSSLHGGIPGSLASAHPSELRFKSRSRIRYTSLDQIEKRQRTTLGVPKPVTPLLLAAPIHAIL